MGKQAHQHSPGDLVPPPPPHHVALLDLDDAGIQGVDAGNSRPEEHPVPPILDPGNQEESAHPGQGARNEVATGRVAAAPGTSIHPVVHAPTAVGAAALEVSVFIPALRPAAPGTVPHRVLHAATAAPIAAGIHAKSARSLERLRAGVPLLVNVGTTPGAVGKLLRHSPPALVTVGAGHSAEVIPPLRPATGRAEVPVTLHDVTADAPLVAGPG
ncbi:MAG: hypothetical protein H0V18_07470 [Pyrinomonadaceae bacterium]|nr:hypothetical protein [Pyrinomonadaceae bacterium]